MLSPSTEVLISSVLQVVGKKYIRLYPSFLQDELYPYSETMLCNSSQVSFFIRSQISFFGLNIQPKADSILLFQNWVVSNYG